MRHEVLIRTSDGRRQLVIDDDFCQSLSVPVTGNEDSVSLFVASWITLLADSPLEPENKPFQLYRRFLNRIRLKGLKSVVLEFSDLAHQLVSQHSLMGGGSSIGDWIDGFKNTPVFFEYHRYFQTGDVQLLNYLYTFLNFGKKLEFVDEEFNKVAFRNWLDIENKLANLHIDDNYLSAIKRILSSILPSFTFTDFWPKFGPGSVQERGVRGRIDKLSSLRFDPLVDRFLFHGHIGMYGYGEDHGLTVEKVIPDPTKWTPASGISSRTARLRFVPKNLKVSRSICMEPNTLMFFQQAVARRFIELIGDSCLRNSIRIHDQSRNRDLALIGSYTGEIDTLDLSSASDSLSYELVKAVFPPSWQIPMRATRSHNVILPDGSLHQLKKFAPMGSALCFPTQCILFASVCILAACLYTKQVDNVDSDFLDCLTPGFIWDVLRNMRDTVSYDPVRLQPFAVYGDDICIDGRLTHIVKSILAILGFSVNHEKSFCGSQAFRESCGGFYLNGHDITPLYFRVKGVRSQLSSSHVVSQVHLINECFSRRFVHTYRFLHHSLMTWGCRKRLLGKSRAKNSIPYVLDSNTFGILCKRPPENSHLQTRENEGYQRTEYRAWTISYDSKQQPGDSTHLVEAYEHMRWWASRPVGDTSADQKAALRYDTGGSGIQWRWIPLY